MYAKVFASMWDGTLHNHWEAWTTFVYMLAHCDRDGFLDKTPEAIAGGSGLPLEVVLRGIAVLEAPDAQSRSVAESGARIVRLHDNRAWGWSIVNHGYYRGLQKEQTRREQLAAAQKRRREVIASQEASSIIIGNEPIQSAEYRDQKEEEANTSCPEPSATGSRAESPGIGPERAGGLPTLVRRAFPDGPPGDVIEYLPVNLRGVSFPIHAVDVDEWVRLFPAVDVVQQLRAMRAWLLVNPGKRKTPRGVLRFVVSWLSREQDRGGRPEAAKAFGGPRRGHRAGVDERYRQQNPGVFTDDGGGDGR